MDSDLWWTTSLTTLRPVLYLEQTVERVDKYCMICLRESNCKNITQSLLESLREGAGQI